jgi:hypothetical protein
MKGFPPKAILANGQFTGSAPELALFILHGKARLAVNRIVSHQVSQLIDGSQIVNGDDLEISRRALDGMTEHHPPDSAKAVDCCFHGSPSLIPS